LDQALIDELSNPENIEDLKNLLLYHILPGATLTTELVEGPTNTLFTGHQVDVGLDPTRFDNANVVTPDIVACNGYIDVIDGVLNPFPDPFCAAFTFDRRVRRLQDEGENCNDNVLYVAKLNPDLEIITSLIELAGLDPIFSCAGKEMDMIVFESPIL
jgi:Fasciclin domain